MIGFWPWWTVIIHGGILSFFSLWSLWRCKVGSLCTVTETLFWVKPVVPKLAFTFESLGGLLKIPHSHQCVLKLLRWYVDKFGNRWTKLSDRLEFRRKPLCCLENLVTTDLLLLASVLDLVRLYIIKSLNGSHKMLSYTLLWVNGKIGSCSGITNLERKEGLLA